MITLIHRHLKLFFQKPSNILLSFASSFIILALYFLFIRDFMIKAIYDMQIQDVHIEQFVDELMISGLLIVINATSMLSILSIFINDKTKNIIKDFLITPLHKIKVYYSYIIACILCAMFISCIVFIITLLFLSIYYETTYSISCSLKIILILLISSVLSSHLLFLITLFIKTISSFSNISNLFGVLVGFCTGVYIPIGYYPKIIRNITFLFPLSQTTSLIRQLSTKETLTLLSKNYPTQIVDTISTIFGVKLQWGNHIITFNNQIIFLIIYLIFLVILVIIICLTKNNHK